MTESRFILDCSALTPHLPAPRFSLPPLPHAFRLNSLHKNAYIVKVDLAEAFYHFSLSPSARRLTTFFLDGAFYRFTRLFFGIRPALFLGCLCPLPSHATSAPTDYVLGPMWTTFFAHTPTLAS